MLDAVYSLSCLEGYDGVHEYITCPRYGTLSGWTIRKIEYFDLESNRDMDGFLGVVLSRILSAALPVIALLDALSSPCKAIYFGVVNRPNAAISQMVATVNFLALSVFSLLSLPFAMYQPTLMFHSSSTWDEIKQKHIQDELNGALQQAREDYSEILNDAEVLSVAISKTLPKVFKKKNTEDTIEPIIQALTEQLRRLPDESAILMEHFTKWVSIFVVACHREKLPIEAIDQNFLNLITETLKLKNPQLRVDLTNQLVKDFARDASVVNSFKGQLRTFEERRQEKVSLYIEERKKTKLLEKQRLEEKILQTEEQIEQSNSQLRELELLNQQPDTGRSNLRKNEKVKSQLQKKVKGLSKKIKSLQESLPSAGVVDDAFLSEAASRADKIYPPFTSSHQAYLPLYFTLVHATYSDEIFQFLSSRVFKDCHQAHFLLNFLLLLNKHSANFSPTDMLDGLQKAGSLDENLRGRKPEHVVQFLKNSTILLQLKEWERLRKGLRDEEKPLYSISIIPELFKERFNLDTEDRYQGEKGNETFLKDYEASIAKFRDPTTVMMLYSTYTLLDLDESKKAIEGLAEFVLQTLRSPEDLNRRRHDINLSPHLKECYKRNPSIQSAWEACVMSELTNDDGKYKGYTIGEASMPCDLAMCSQEVLKSCLHPSGRPCKVKGFLGVLLDGKIHPVVIKEPGGKIVARMLLKLMLSDTSEALCLMKDTVYTSSHQLNEINFFEKAILDYSLQRARELDVPLVSPFPEDSSAKESKGPVYSKFSPAPFEHVNAFEGPNLTSKVVFENGDYTIPKVYAIN